MSKKKTYNKGNLPKVFELMVMLHRDKPEAFENASELRREAEKTWGSLKDESRCPNCKASMHSYWFEFDVIKASMLVAMSRIVRARVEKGIPFTEANEVHVQSMNTASYAMKSQTTQMAKLGLVAKVLKNGKHQSGYWLITRRGFAALANAKVPKRVESFRNQIIERDEGEKTTISQVFAEWSMKKRELIRRGKQFGTDYQQEVDEHKNREDWVHFGRLQPGELI